MKEILRLVGTLTAIAVAAGLLLAVVNAYTEEPIRQAERALKLEAIKAVLPPYDNQPDAVRAEIEDEGRNWTFYVARKDGAFRGAAFETGSRKGYGGEIRLMAGVTASGKLCGIEILKQKETPGLGAKIEDADFKAFFAERDIYSTKWQVKKDGGDIDEITAATISSRAVTEAVKQGLDVYRRHEKEIRETQAPAPAAGKEAG